MLDAAAAMALRYLAAQRRTALAAARSTATTAAGERVSGIRRRCRGVRGRPCGELTTSTRCEDCQREWDRLRNARRTHYHGDYRRRAELVKATATECWLCWGPRDPDDPFQADHVDAGDADSPLAAAHGSCNRRRGNRPAFAGMFAAIAGRSSEKTDGRTHGDARS